MVKNVALVCAAVAVMIFVVGTIVTCCASSSKRESEFERVMHDDLSGQCSDDKG